MLADSGNLDRMMTGIFAKVATTLRYHELPTKKQILVFPLELNKITIPHMWAKLALVDIPKDSEMSDTAVVSESGSGESGEPEGFEADEKNLRDLSEIRNKIYRDFLEHLTVCLTCFRHPVDLAAHLIVAMSKQGPSKRMRDNVSIGCALANLVLLAHQYPLITRTMQDQAEFVSRVNECVENPMTDHSIQRVYSLPIRSHLESILEKSEKSCQACGISESNHKKQFPQMGNLKVCGGCRAVSYCCRSCQEKDRSIHKNFCKENVSEIDPKKRYIEFITDQGGKVRFHASE